MAAAITEDLVFSRLLFPALVGLICLALTWSLDRSVSRGAPRTPARSKLLSHGFLFVTGGIYLMAWNNPIAKSIGFPGSEVWKPLTAVWGLLVFYDGWRRVETQRMRQVKSTLNDEASTTVTPARAGWRLNLASVFRLLAFFALLGAISTRRVLAFIVVAVIIAAIWLLERKCQPDPQASTE